MHQEAAHAPAALAPLLRLPPAWDRDPIALLLGALAVALALAYAVAVLRGARPAVRGALIAIAATVLVLLPTLGFVALGAATGRPYGQDGGVVQLPLALDRILAGRSPYGGDYSDSILGKEARVSDFWTPYGGNPILHHHAYLPGTHLLMMPFYLAARAVGATFDPRLVTLLAYALAALLAARLPADPSARLAAAAVVAVNPLVYWQQIFGANDLVVAALLLLAVRLGSRRPFLASAVVGLACATKQLAWPFAPFLLVSFADVREARELAASPARARLARLALVSLAVWIVVVAPVALLDLRAFWGDIVVYNLGLGGGDAYPFGGTPGFGFANLLIYAGRVSSLRDHVSLGWSWLLLAPLGLLLLRRQMREGTEATALLTGSVMLLASLYFSRVVHANYLILAATLLPVAALASRRVPADVPVVPLLLLALAVETVENGLFRATWAQAVESGLPARLGGWARALAPRAGPGLTDDPLGLLIAALAAGLGILYLVAGVFGAPLRLRLGGVLMAALAMVVVPTLAVVGIGKATGLVRSQDRWTARLVQDDRLLHGAPVPPVAEAWSTSFQQDPPARIEVVPPMSPGSAAMAWLLHSLKADPRVLSLIAVLAVAFLAPRLVSAEQRPIVLGVALLSPSAAVGTIFGSGDMVLLAAILAAVLLSRSSRALAAGAATGVATAIVPRALLAAPFLLLPVSAQPAVLPLIVGLGVGWGMAVVPLLAAGPSTLAVSLLPTARLEPGIGLANLWLDLGHAGATAAMALGIFTAVLAAVGSIAALRIRAEFPRLYALAGTLLLAGLFTAPGASPHDLAAPMVLLLLGVVAQTRA
jgi:glycosyl transferase family 87